MGNEPLAHLRPSRDEIGVVAHHLFMVELEGIGLVQRAMTQTDHQMGCPDDLFGRP